MSKTIVITGATSGLGLETVKRIALHSDAHVIAGARSPDGAEALRLALPADRLTLLPLDVASLASVRAFAEAVKQELGAGKIDALALNAGLQFTGRQPITDDGVCLNFATNHLGHFLLSHLLMENLAPGATVVSTCSGTHHPDEKLANLFGFRGAIFPSAERVAQGDLWDEDVDNAQAGMDLYATSKLCNIYFMRDMAARVPAQQVRFVGFDPGLMAGTGLARDRGAAQQWAWRNVMPLLRFVLNPLGARMSTPQISGHALAGYLLDETPFSSGEYKDFRGGEADISELALSREKAAELYEVSAALCGVDPV